MEQATSQRESGKKAAAIGTGVIATRCSSESVAALKQIASGQTTQELKSELARLLGFSAENLLRMAIVVTELETRGEDLSHLKIGLLPILRRIASGQLLPDIVVLFAGQPSALKEAAKLPIETQARVARKEEPLPLPPARPYVPRTPTPRPTSETNQPNLHAIAAHATPRDIGELAEELIVNSKDRVATMTYFLSRLVAGKVLPAAATAWINDVQASRGKKPWEA